MMELVTLLVSINHLTGRLPSFAVGCSTQVQYGTQLLSMIGVEQVVSVTTQLVVIGNN